MLKSCSHSTAVICCAFDELINDIYTTSIGYLGIYCGIQSKEQHNRTFSNLVLCGKLCKLFRFFCGQETWEFLQLNELASDEIDVINETVSSVLAGIFFHEPPPLLYIGGIRQNAYF